MEFLHLDTIVWFEHRGALRPQHLVNLCLGPGAEVKSSEIRVARSNRSKDTACATTSVHLLLARTMQTPVTASRREELTGEADYHR